MKVTKIRGGMDYMDVYFGDRVVRIYGELLVDGFVGFKDAIVKWKIPDGEPISDSEREEIIEAVLDDVKDCEMKIVFE